MNDPWVQRLSEYIDGEMPPEDRHEFEAHLESCESCRVMLRDLEQIVGDAGRLEEHVPSEDLWGAIAARIGESRDAPAEHVVPIEAAVRSPRRSISFSWPQLLAACLALVMASGAMGWLARSWRPDSSSSPAHPMVAERTPPEPATGGDRATPPEMTVAEKGRTAPEPGSPRDGQEPEASSVVPASAGQAQASPTLAEAMVGLDKRIAELQRAFVQYGRSLDPETLAVFQDNLYFLDQAISDARAALAQDPQSEYLNAHLADSMMRKVRFLQQAADIAGTEI